MPLLSIENLALESERLRGEGKKLVLCHGCFDLMHPGHIKYFQAAKKFGDILMVTVTPDRFVDKGPGRPAFGEQLRAESIEALRCVDYVALNAWPTAEETLRRLRPHYYVKGQEFENLVDKTGKINKEVEVVGEIGAEMKFTHEVVFSSTELLNSYFKEKRDKT
jgi:rfaE bifunctional protein nucleotidyltransferase chain/domain